MYLLLHNGVGVRRRSHKWRHKQTYWRLRGEHSENAFKYSSAGAK